MPAKPYLLGQPRQKRATGLKTASTGISKGRKPRTKSYAALKRDLDRVFSIWTRRRFATPYFPGQVACVCCGAVKRWQEQQCSHFVSRSYLATRWHPENCAPSCFQCNVFKKGNLA